MKPLLAPLIFVLSCAIAAAAETSFTSTLTPDELKAAGLDKLSPAQLDRLNAFVESYKTDEVTREVEVARNEEKQEARKRAMKDEPIYVESRIVGEISGWSGRTLFHLENGEVWQQANTDTYYYGRVQSPKVVIKEALFGGSWMYIEGFPRVRVRRVK